AAGRNVGRVSVVIAKQQRPVAHLLRLVVNRHGPDPNLSMLLRSHAVAHSLPSYKIAALRLSLSRHSWGAAGKDFQTSRLLASQRHGEHGEGTELGYLFSARTAGGGIGTKSKMFTGLRTNRCGVQT